MRKATDSLGLSQIYKQYKAIEENPLTEKEFKAVCYEFNKLASKEIIENSQILKLPYRLGELSIQKKKLNYNRLRFDFNTFNKTGIKAFHVNKHSDEYIAYFYWCKKKCKVKGKRYYHFKPTRCNSRAIAKVMNEPDGHKKYYMK
jgi:hypothetical protein